MKKKKNVFGGILAGLGTLEGFGFSTGWDRTKDFGGTRFKGYTTVVSEVNRRQQVSFG
ncbi:MAG: hypothetical protein NVV83_02755 [Afipia sp.]|nr:hypothetical protein [Afipia sp.]